MIEVSVPSVEHQAYDTGKTCTLKKNCKVPDFPLKRVPNWRPKVQEQRRQGLETYIQGVLWYNKDVPKDLLDFLKIRHFHKDKRNCNLGSISDITTEESRLTHKAVVGFYKDKYFLPPETDILENSVLRGVLQGIYQQQDHRLQSQTEPFCSDLGLGNIK
ncbi:hypothetical protein GDO86_006185 [Hymenochirus boettgeri]|uniref:Sorting nexin 22 n=1 Tax=Hymenochirus boettgeri TaxID=247094 RepID=A0A8T2JA44_9PIPI|nr:hypothetical protein GDO86_006185 [Hymenochirus boettgeri]